MHKKEGNAFLILLALWLMVFAASSQVIIIAPILPRIGEALQVTEALLGLLGTAYALLLFVFALIAGPVSDKIGRRPILLIGCGFMAIALALHAFADSFWALLTVRSLAGAAGGILSGSAVAYVGDYFPYERRGWASGWVMSGIAFGQILGIPIGTILADQYDYRMPFTAFAGVMAVAFLVVCFFVPQPDVKRDTRVLTLKRALRNYGRLLLRRDPAAAVAAYILMFLGYGLYVYYLPLWLESEVGLTGTQVASLFLVGGLGNVVAGPVAGHLSDRIGRKPVVAFACFGLGALVLVTTVVVVDLVTAYLLFGAAMILGTIRISPLQALMTAIVPEQKRGILMSLSVAMGQLAFGLGSALAGLTYTAWGYTSNTVAAALFIVLMAVVVTFVMSEPDA